MVAVRPILLPTQFLLLVCAALIWTIGFVRNDALVVCLEIADDELRVEACTPAIEPGRWSGRYLAPAYKRRGSALDA